MKEYIKWLVVFLGILSTNITFGQNVVRYDLTITDTIVNFSGKEKRAIAVNGQIPMPTLTFTEGDIAEIVVHNKLKESTSLHWHGVFSSEQRGWCSLFNTITDRTLRNLYLSFSNYSKWHTLVSQS